MTVRNLIEKLGLEVLAGCDALDNEINGCYCCDLLSWVMAHAQPGNIWITIQTHSNIVAVAMLTDISCIIIPEAISVDEDTITRANENSVVILRSKDNAYVIAGQLHALNI